MVMNNLRISIEPRLLHFRQPAGTSRGVYTTRQIWLLRATASDCPGRVGVGECAPLPDLSCDWSDHYADDLRRLCDAVEARGDIDEALLRPYPSVLFALETALMRLRQGDVIYDTPFARGEQGIPINGLVWMGSFDEMNRRMEQKLNEGFTCVKLKIGAIDFDSELALVKSIRKRFSPQAVELRVDANGGFSVADAPLRLEQLARYGIHSIEQPIRLGDWQAMARLCATTPLPIALDEELIGVNDTEAKRDLLDTVRPQYVVLKPSLHGGLSGTREWIRMARERQVGCWITSALEGSVGLDAVAQLAACEFLPDASAAPCMAQGLGTGTLYTDNLEPRTVVRGNLIYRVPGNGQWSDTNRQP